MKIIKRGDTYYLDYRDGQNKRQRISLKTSKSHLAEAKARKIISSAEEERILGKPSNSDITFSELSKRYLDSEEQKTKTWYQRIQGIVKNHLEPFFGKYKIKDIRKEMGVQYVEKRKREPIVYRKISKTRNNQS